MYGPVGSTVSFTFGSTSIMSARVARASDCTSRGYGASISLSAARGWCDLRATRRPFSYRVAPRERSPLPRPHPPRQIRGERVSPPADPTHRSPSKKPTGVTNESCWSHPAAMPTMPICSSSVSVAKIRLPIGSRDGPCASSRWRLPSRARYGGSLSRSCCAAIISVPTRSAFSLTRIPPSEGTSPPCRAPP